MDSPIKTIIRHHMLYDKNKKVKTDGRFKIFKKPKENQSEDRGKGMQIGEEISNFIRKAVDEEKALVEDVKTDLQELSKDTLNSFVDKSKIKQKKIGDQLSAETNKTTTGITDALSSMKKTRDLASQHIKSSVGIGRATTKILNKESAVDDEATDTVADKEEDKLPGNAQKEKDETKKPSKEALKALAKKIVQDKINNK